MSPEQARAFAVKLEQDLLIAEAEAVKKITDINNVVAAQEATGINKGTISRYINGHAKMRPRAAIRILKA